MRFCVSHHSVYFCKVLLPLQENISQNNPKGLKQNFSQLYVSIQKSLFNNFKFFSLGLQKNTQILDRRGRQCCNPYKLLKSVFTTAQVKHVIFVLLDKKLLIFLERPLSNKNVASPRVCTRISFIGIVYPHSRFANAKCVVKQ